MSYHKGIHSYMPIVYNMLTALEKNMKDITFNFLSFWQVNYSDDTKDVL